MPLIVFVINSERFYQIHRVARENEGVGESLVEVGVELYFIDHVGLVYYDVAGLARAVLS